MVPCPPCTVTSVNSRLYPCATVGLQIPQRFRTSFNEGFKQCVWQVFLLFLTKAKECLLLHFNFIPTFSYFMFMMEDLDVIAYIFYKVLNLLSPPNMF